MRPAAWFVLALALGSPWLAHGADATPTSLQLVFAEVPDLVPGRETVVQGTLAYTYDAPSRNATRATLSAGAVPTWLHATVEPGTLALNATSAAGRSEAPVVLRLLALHGTPALNLGSFEVRVDAADNPPLDASAGSASVLTRVAFTGEVRAQAPTEALRARPGEPLSFRVTLTNQANGPARVAVEALGAPEGMHVVGPGPVILDPDQAREVSLGVLAAGPGRATLTLRWTAAHAFDPAATLEASTAEVEVEVAGEGAPGPAVGAVLVAAGLAAVAVRRRRA